MSMDKPTSRSFPICPKCNESCFKSDGQLVRALNQVYHYSCFVCEDCSLSVADKYYYLIEKRRRIILCQYHYTKRSAMETVGCVQCPPKTIHSFYYELNGKSYCRIHYSLLPKTQCFGCHQAVLKQFVQHRDIPEKIWHPECYMIYKFWGVKLAPLHQPGSDELIKCQAMIENTVNRVWTDLSSFEESAANCISDMLLHVASGSYSETIDVTNQFIMHLEVLFNALDFIDLQLISFGSSLNCSREASFVCSQILQFLELLNHPSPTITQDLSSLVTGLAQNLKSLIRIGLSTSLRLEQELEIENTILNFLQYLLALEKKRVWIDGRYWFKENIAQIEQLNITCHQCNLTITEEYYTCRELYWHPSCFQCSVCSEHINYKEPVAFDERNQPICCAVPNQTLFTCTYVSLLQHLLYNLKLHLSQVTNKQALYNKEDNTVLLLGSKRRKSLLGILNKQQQQPTETNKIHLGQVQSSYEIRRAFSMGSSSAPISNLFRKHSKKSPKRASVFSLHGHAFIQTLPSSQDCLLHHVAALSLQPLLNNAVLDTKSSPPAHHPSVLWGKLMTHIKAKNMNEHRIFGVPLSVVVNRDKERTRTKTNAMTCFDFSTGLTASFSENASIPIFIKSLITTILQTDMSVEGVFRKNGNIRQLKLLADSIDKLNDQTLSEQSIGEAQRRLLVNQSPIQLAALLKRYLRELPEPLLTFGLYKLFIQCGKMDNSKHLLHIACCLLPKPNRDTMLMIFCCLKWIGGFSETNRMDICNLARVIAPSVLYSSPPHTCDGELRQGTQDEILVIENLIKYSDDMSVIPPDLIILPIQTDEKKNGQRRLSWIPGKNK